MTRYGTFSFFLYELLIAVFSCVEREILVLRAVNLTKYIP